MNKVLFILFCLFGFGALAQQQDEQLAAQYMSAGEFTKAAELYERLLGKSKSMYLYDNLLSCYFKLNDFDAAEKLVKKQSKRFDTNIYYAVDLGFVYEKSNQTAKAEKAYQAVVQKVNPTYDATLEAANAFRKRAKTDFAIAVYLKARKQNGNNDKLFCVELAQLYGEKHETALMLNEYLTAVMQQPEMLADVQGYLQLYLDDDTDYALLKQALQKKLKEYPASELHSEMLIWLYVQRKDFDNALLQTRAMDKRNREQGRRLLMLADLALDNDSYDAATKIYQEIITLGSDKPYYLNAKLGVLKAKNKKVVYNGVYTSFDLQGLEQDYYQFLKEFGRYEYTATSIKELAQLQAYYLFKYDSAITNYNEIIEMPRLDKRFKAECKLELGDIYVLKNEVWEAMLLYGQVDKEFLEDPLGQEAKYRNAKLSYYLGEFEWSRAQLDVLKTATTQLIANNAIELSLQIQDNTVDSNEEPLRWFARADLYYFQNRLTDALRVLDSIKLVYPKHELADDVWYKLAEIAIKQKNYTDAARLFELVYNEHGTGILGDNALFELGYLQESKLANNEQAQKYYELFIEKYPGSFFLNEVRKRYRSLRGDRILIEQ